MNVHRWKHSAHDSTGDHCQKDNVYRACFAFPDFFKIDKPPAETVISTESQTANEEVENSATTQTSYNKIQHTRVSHHVTCFDEPTPSAFVYYYVAQYLQSKHKA